jgi:two-component system chemotaxis sensor kinase CheA
VSIEPIEAIAPPPVPPSGTPGTDARIRVSAAKVDDLIDLVGELVVTQSMVAELVEDAGTGHAGRLQELVAQMSRHTRELEARAMAMRMVPIRVLFSRFTRIVRDLAQASGKEVTLETCGEDTELDRSLIEQMTDPLTHLLRNAVDHGLEAPEVRRRAGKPDAGRLTLAAYHRGGSVFIEVADDGHGLDRDRIVAKARALGWLGAADPIGDDDAFALIFRAGFTTAEHVSEMSGRGVGMDVVVKNVRAAGGTVSLQTTAGQGTRFTIKLPLTVASFDGQAVRVGGEVYVVPLLAIVESVRPGRGDVRTVAGTGEALVLRGEIIPLVRLARVIGATPAAEDPAGSLFVIVEDGARRLALLVDELLSQQHVVIKSLETNFVRVDGIAGATVLGDGRVALILDVAGIIARWRAGSAAVPATKGACP